MSSPNIKEQLDALIKGSSCSDSIFVSSHAVEDKEYLQAREQAVRSIGNYFGRSKLKVAQLLIKKGYSKELATKVASDLERDGYANDSAAANSVIARHNTGSKIKGRPILKQLLFQAGINKTDADKALSQLKPEVVRLIELIGTLQHRYTDETKLMRYLNSRGFAYSLCKEAYRIISDENQTES